MATRAAVGEKIDIGPIIQRGFGTIGRHGAVFLVLAGLLVGVPQFVTQYLMMDRMMAGDLRLVLSPLYWITMLVTILTGFLLQAALVRGSIQDLQGKPVQVGPNVLEALKLLLPMIGLTILSSLAIGIGLVLLIVPGIIVYIMLSVAVPVLVEERQGVVGSMTRSADLTKGSRWRIFLLLILFLVVYLVLSAILGALGIGLMTASPATFAFAQAVFAIIMGLFTATMVASLYVELRTVKEGAAVESLGEIFS